jgi:molybdopterin-guanine dinucleotide biosynthesis protein A
VFLDNVRVRYVEEAEIDRFDPRHLSFFNVNTPEDLMKAQEIAAGIGST